jgi:hypothetical protein
MTRFIRVDQMPKVITYNMDITTFTRDKELWSQEFLEWQAENSEKIKGIHRNKDLANDRWQFALEFIDEEEATIFAMRFA